MTVHIVKNQGVSALYSGLSASLLRQLTYSTTRFAIYDVSIIDLIFKNLFEKKNYQKSPSRGIEPRSPA